MDVKRLKRLRRKLDDFAELFSDCIKTAPSRRHMRTYVRGQLSDLKRKNVASIALEANLPPRTLQEFLQLKRWGHEAVRHRTQQLVAVRHPDQNAIGVIDETGYAKKGNKTAGVQRQYCGATGKKDNCTVTVHLGYVSKDFHALVDGDLYVPEGWFADPQRCREAGMPDTLRYRPKWQIALELVIRTLAAGVKFKFLAADEEYGHCSRFRTGVAAQGIIYVLEVPRSTRGWTKQPAVVEPTQATAGQGRPRTRRRLAASSSRARRVDRLWKRGGPSWQTFHIKDTEKGPTVWQARVCRFFPSEDGLPGQQGWLIVARNVLDGEVKYFLSNAPADAPGEVLLHVAFSRAHIEQLFKESKGQIGLDHFEVRHYQPLMRHLILSMVSLMFLVEQTQKLRGGKSVVDSLPGSRGH